MQKLDAPTPKTQTELRHWAFARQICETTDVAVAYRNTFRPGKDVNHNDYIAGTKLLGDVAGIVRQIAEPALIELGVEKSLALRRLLETVESDITEFCKNDGSYLSMEEIKAMPHEKRRLIKKLETAERGKKGRVVTNIVLESKEKALHLLGQIQGWIKPAGVTVNNNVQTVVAQLSREELDDEIRKRMTPELWARLNAIPGVAELPAPAKGATSARESAADAVIVNEPESAT
jgi:hypothetical protein